MQIKEFKKIIKENLKRGSKLQAVKSVKFITGLGLRDSKDLVDSFDGSILNTINKLSRDNKISLLKANYEDYKV